MKKAGKKSKAALDGLRILDLSMWWAGPRTTRLLAEAGAEVIKVESLSHPDPWRGAATAQLEAKGLFPEVEPNQRINLSPGFNLENTNKMGIALDLSKEAGREVLKKLVQICDVLVENYSPRVMKNFGLEYAQLKECNRQLVMISMPAFGLDGPERDYVAFGATLECMMGITYLTGYHGEGPMALSHTAYTDPIGGINAAFAILVALRHRRRTGEGMHIEMSQLESAIPFISPAIMDYTMNGRVQGRMGNRHKWLAPHGCYRCLGDDAWVTLSIESDDDWRNLCTVMVRSDLIEDGRFADTMNRWKHQDELDPIISEWTGKYESYEVMKLLQGAGITAGPVLNAGQIVHEPHLRSRGFYQEIDHPVAGRHSYSIAHPQLSETPVGIRKPAPCFAEHNHYVLKELLGMSETEIDRLKEEGIICDEFIVEEE